MILKQEEIKGLNINTLREKVAEAEKELGRKVTVIVGTKENVTDEMLHELLPMVELQVKKRNMKFAATQVGALGAGFVTLNILFAEYLYDDNACANFLIKQVKYSLTKINFVD